MGYWGAGETFQNLVSDSLKIAEFIQTAMTVNILGMFVQCLVMPHIYSTVQFVLFPVILCTVSCCYICSLLARSCWRWRWWRWRRWWSPWSFSPWSRRERLAAGPGCLGRKIMKQLTSRYGLLLKQLKPRYDLLLKTAETHDDLLLKQLKPRYDLLLEQGNPGRFNAETDETYCRYDLLLKQLKPMYDLLLKQLTSRYDLLLKQLKPRYGLL